MVILSILTLRKYRIMNKRVTARSHLNIKTSNKIKHLDEQLSSLFSVDVSIAYMWNVSVYVDVNMLMSKSICSMMLMLMMMCVSVGVGVCILVCRR